MESWIELGKEFVLPLAVAIIGYFAGRKSAAENKRIEYETEMASLKEFRELRIADNKSLISEIKDLKKQIASMQAEIKVLSKNQCDNFTKCTVKDE